MLGDNTDSCPTLVTCPVMAYVTPAPTSMVPALMIPKAAANSGSLKDFNDVDDIVAAEVAISLSKKKTAERIETPFKVFRRRLLVASSAVGVAAAAVVVVVAAPSDLLNRDFDDDDDDNNFDDC